MTFRIVAVPAVVSEEARATGKAPGYGHPVHRDVATGYGPCRSCLQPFATGIDRRLLFTFDPFREQEPFPLPGPIYVHEDPCPEYETADHFPDSLRFIPMTMNGYGRGRRLRTVRRVEPNGDAEGVITAMFADPELDYIHVRNTEAGCYIFRIERA